MLDNLAVTSDGGARLVPAVGPLEGVPVDCQLDALDQVSARLRLPPPHRLPEMTSVALWLTDPDSGSAVVIPAYVGWPDAEGEEEVWEIYFAQPNALYEHGNKADRRSAVRVAPAPEEVEIWLHPNPETDEAVECVLVDLSEGGMCVELTVGLEPATPFSLATFQLLLPGETWPLILQAQVRHRSRLSREIIRYGLQFDTGRTPDFAAQQGRIAQFVMDRVTAIAQRVDLAITP